jgi:hypothetical protein
VDRRTFRRRKSASHLRVCRSCVDHRRPLYVFMQHRIDAMIVLRMITAPVFLVLYMRSSMWAWYLAVAEGPVFLLLYWWLLALGGLSRPPRPVSYGFQIGVTVFQLVLLVGIMVWLFMLREPYSRYIAHARSSRA